MAESKKRKIESECRKYQTRWENEYFFIEVKGKCVCLICNDTVAVMKEYNVYNVLAQSRLCAEAVLLPEVRN